MGDSADHVDLSVVIPAYNEVRRLPPTLERLRTYLDGRDESYEVIVVDDGSDDGTSDRAEQMAACWPQLRVFGLVPNMGKGAAVRHGILRARGAHRAFSDADLSTPIEELARLRAHLSNRCGVAIASRDLPGSDIEVRQPGWREFMGRTYNHLLRFLVLPGIRDSQCGLKVYRADVAEACFRPLHTMRFGFDAEVLLRARRGGSEIAEVPVRWRHVEESRVGGFGDASRMLLDLLRLRFGRL